MQKPEFIHDKNELERFLLRYRHLNFYHLGDLDDFFWPYTSWLALKDQREITALTLLYTGIQPAAFLAIVNDNYPQMETLLRNSLAILPKSFYAHLSPGLEGVLQEGGFQLDLHGAHLKMALTKQEMLENIDTSAVEQLGLDDLPEMKDLYEKSYPGNWFDARMLETGQYAGVRSDAGELVGVAGIHVYSPVYKIAALGNITTLPALRGQGLGKTATAGLCKQLLKTVDAIGLNVRADNAAAIAAYSKIGFEPVGEYSEWMVQAKQ